MKSGHKLKIKRTEFADKLDTGYKGRKRFKENPKAFRLSGYKTKNQSSFLNQGLLFFYLALRFLEDREC